MIKVGFTFDLREDYLSQGFSAEDAAEFDIPETIDAIETALIYNHFAVERIGNIQALVGALAVGKRWDIVFNICEGVKGIGREAQVPALLEAYDIPVVFASSDIMVLTMNKALAKHVVRSKNIPTADFEVISELTDIDNINLAFPVFVKPLAEGTSKGITSRSVVRDKETLRDVCAKMITTFKQPALVEVFLPGRDLTVGVVGAGDSAQVIAVMETVSKVGAESGSQSYYNKVNWEEVLEYKVITDETAKMAAKIALQSWNALNCVDGGRVDLRCDTNGIPNFIEVNTIAGLNPNYSDLPMLSKKSGVSYNDLIGKIMQHALKRYGIQHPNIYKKIAEAV